MSRGRGEDGQGWALSGAEDPADLGPFHVLFGVTFTFIGLSLGFRIRHGIMAWLAGSVTLGYPVVP